MSITIFDTKVKVLKKAANRFDENSSQQKMQYLMQLAQMKLPENKTLLSYFEVLLFICAYPPDEKLLSLAKNELLRISKFMKKSNKRNDKIFTNSGLPFSKYVSRFSHDFVHWLLSHPDCRTEINVYQHATFELNEVLKLTLPTLERCETTAGLSNYDLLETLLVKKQNQLSFIITELSKLNDTLYIKDHLYDGLSVYLNIHPKDKYFSRAYNRLLLNKVYYHNELIKHFSYQSLFNTALPPTLTLTKAQHNEAIKAVKNSMALTNRETDPTTYLDENSFRLYEMERGVSVAIYGMIAQRQLPLESYVGYTLFKNGYPAAYGGCWVFGERANFGINIFESFRGGESGYIMCQLLRLYRQVFKINYFEVEPYQFGLDNPEGIASGAFWFYYRYGFRPLDRALLKISNEEQKKIMAIKNYRTNSKTLIKFTESNIALNLAKKIPEKVSDIIIKVTRMTERNYKGNRLKAEHESVIKFKNKTGLKTQFNKNENQVLQEVALWAEALEINEKDKLNLLTQMIKIKPVDLYSYQKLLLQFFKK